MVSTHARAFAIEAHGDQAYGAAPYVVHLDAVAALIEGPATPQLLAVAYLHDVLEDTPVTFDALVQRFGSTVAQAVDLVTDPPGETRRARKTRLHARLAALTLEAPASVLALHVKAADRLANVQACVRDGDTRLSMYRAEHVEFRPAAYRDGLCPGLWRALDGLLG